jgi:hypothetical protein
MEYIRLAVPKELHAEIKKLAQDEGMTMTDFLRQVVKAMSSPREERPSNPVDPVPKRGRAFRPISEIASAMAEKELRSM